MSGTGTTRTGRARRLLTATIAATMIAGMATVASQGTAAAVPSGDPQADTDWRAKRLAAWRNASDTPVQPGAAEKRVTGSRPGLPTAKPPTVTWPSAATATVEVSAAQGASVKPGGLPVKISTPAGSVRAGERATRAQVDVQVLDQAEARAADVDGVLLRLRPQGRTPGTTTVTVNYSAFAGAYGGDWASRLRVVELPDCATTTPQRRECRTETPIETINDTSAGTVTATVPTGAAAATAAAGRLFAVTADTAGGAGDWSATPLAASATWQTSAQTGDFSWSYPVRVPPSPGGPAPDLALSYSSSMVDGRVAVTNNQTSWIGDGWEFGSGSVERKYASCADDATEGANNVGHKTGDLCWKTDNATLNLNGQASELVKDTSGTWRLKDDDGSKVERLSGSWNEGQDGEYWRLTTTDGTQYFFGRDKRSASDPADLDSAWTVPVYGNHPGEPCYENSFASSRCLQVWRWNLDYVVDPHGNSMTYFYVSETNKYGHNLDQGISSYVRGGYLHHIEYGQRSGAETVGSAPARVDFEVAERCLADCGSLTAGTADNWPDVPYDLMCSSSSSCPSVVSPAFFTRKRLTKITTKVRNGSGYDNVDSWALAHTFPSPGDGQSNPVMWLNSIEHTGLRGGSDKLPKVTFTGVQLANRVDAIGDVGPPMIRYRMSWIDTETGGRIGVDYDPADCTPSSLPSAPQSNTRRCMPVYWTPEGDTDPILEYFHRYRVREVVADADPFTVGDPEMVTTYTYVGSPAWHYDESELTPPKQRTWGEFRGYSTVEVRTGAPGNQSRTRLRYFRGMDGDHLPGGGRRDEQVDGIDDHDRYAGYLREEITYDGASGGELSATVNTPWLSPATATAADGAKAFLLGTGTVQTRTTTPALPGGVRRTRTATSYDNTYGMVTQVNDQGDTATTDDDRCTRYRYARNTGRHIVDTVSRAETVAVACGATPARPADVIADVRTFYDGSGTFGAAPTRGLVTKTEQVESYRGDTAEYLTVSTADYDAQGRPTKVGNALGHTTATEYTPATGGPLTRTKVTSPDPDGDGPLTAHVTTTDLDPAFGVPATVTDPNGKVTQATYDALGRLLKVWQPGRATNLTPNLEFKYHVRNDAPSTITTTKLLHDNTQRTTSVQLFDGLGRSRQTQAAALGDEGGRVVTDTRYDARGQVAAVNHDYYDTAAPATDLFPLPTVAPGRTEYVYDGAGRVTTETFLKQGRALWTTTTSYGGDRTTVDPPDGGTPTTTITDARDRVVTLRQYTGGSPTGAHQDTTYIYDRAGRLAGVTDPAENTWSYSYDLLGRQTSATDPDRGTTTSTYDATGMLLTATDEGRGLTLAYEYDRLGRKTKVRDVNATGPLRAEWTYDTLAKGQVTSSTRHDGTASYVTAVTGYDDGYRPLGQSVTLPSTGVPTGEAAIAGTYTTALTYTIDGQLRSVRHPAVANLGEETVTSHYDTAGMPEWMGGGLGWGAYAAGADWSATGQPLLLDLGNTYFQHLSFDYEAGTNRLSDTKLLRQNAPGYDLNLSYDYDDAGNVSSMVDRASGQAVDAQCFRYDGMRRLTEAWTPATADCEADPTAAGLGGPAPYWTSYTFDAVGNRTSEVQHTRSGDTKRNYVYPAARSVGPHRLSHIEQTGVAGSRTYRYQYDTAGNTTCRPAGTETNTCPTGSGSQALTWNAEGHLTTATNTGEKTQTYVYAADGQRLIRRENGVTTVYLPGGQELRLEVATGTKTASRYYTFAGATVAVRTGPGLAGVSTLVADHHATAEIAVANTANTLTRRRHDPYGNPRSAPLLWPGDHGFLGKPKDATGLTHIGAREYDPVIGRFVSVDPIMDLTDPQQWHGYTYANNNPTTLSDPTGLKPAGCEEERRNCRTMKPLPGSDGKEGTAGGGRSGGVKRAPAEVRYGRATVTAPDWETYANAWLATVREWQQPSWFGGVKDLPQRECMEGAPTCQGGLLMHMGFFRDLLCKQAGVVCVGNVDPVAETLVAGNEVGLLTGGKDGSGAMGARSGKARKTSCNSFAPGTLVLLADGTRIPIEDVEVGDVVIATDPETGKTAAKRVTALHLNDDTELTSLVVIGEDGSQSVIETTWHHRFWSTTRRAWVDAADLAPGEALTTVDDRSVTVGAVDNRVGDQAMHDLTVADIHTYYVLAGNTPVLVHNCGTASPHELLRTESLEGPYSKARVADIAASMKENGWVGEGIDVFEQNGHRYVLNGHHRVAAAKQAGIDVKYRSVPASELGSHGYRDASEVVSAAVEVGPDRIADRRGRRR